MAAQSRYDDAIDQYRRAITFGPSESQYRLQLAQTLLQTGRVTEAGAHLAELHEEDPTDAVVNLMIARIDARKNDLANAVTWYHRAIYGFWPANPVRNRIDARWELIQLLAQHGERREVIAELLQLFGESPDDPRLRLRIGRMLLDFGATSNAEEVFNDVVTTNARFVEGWTALADAEMKEGKYAEARNALRRAWRLAPHDADIWKRLETTNDILALDPSLPTLTSQERLHRSQELLSRALASVQECTASSGKTLTDEQQANMAMAQELLQQKRNVLREGQTPRDIGLAIALGQDRVQICGSASSNPALTAVLSMMDKQP